MIFLSNFLLLYVFLIVAPFLKGTTASPVPAVPADKTYLFPQSTHYPSSRRSRFTVAKLVTSEYTLAAPVFGFNNSTGEGILNFTVSGPPGEIMLQVRATETSWDDRTIYKNPFIRAPTSRGTIEIVLSCGLTLALCVWTSFHTNIEPKNTNAGFWSEYLFSSWRKVCWSVVIVLFPECGLCLAMFERRTAARLCRLIEKETKVKANAKEKKDSKANGENLLVIYARWIKKKIRMIKSLATGAKWIKKKFMAIFDWFHLKSGFAIRHEGSTGITRLDARLGYFVVMGGFSVQFCSEADDVLPKDKDVNSIKLKNISYPEEVTYTLTPYGVYFICHHLMKKYPPDKLGEIIDDKSSTGLLARCIVIFQVIWIIIQISSRYSAGMSVTLLETHIVIHAGCTLLTYLTWLHKPNNIKYPIVLSDVDYPAGLMEQIFTHRDDGFGKACYKHDPLNILYSEPTDQQDVAQSPNMYTVPLEWTKTEDSELKCHCPQCRDMNRTRPLLTPRAGQCKLASRMVSDGEPRFNGEFSNIVKLVVAVYNGLRWDQLCRVWRECIAMTVASLIYSGLNLWAYFQAHFPTPTEKYLWTAALIGSAGCGLICVLLFLICLILPKLSNSVSKWALACFYCVALGISIISRLFLVVESFISLRDPSAKAFRVVHWSNYALF